MTPQKKDLDQIDAVAIISMINEMSDSLLGQVSAMNDGLLAQTKSMNNNVAAILRTNLALQETITNLIQNLTETRDQRYQEEIDDLEQQMTGIMKMLEEKRAAKQDNKSTAERLQNAAKAAVVEVQAEERKRKSIDWIDIRNSAVKTAVSVIVGALVVYLAFNAPVIGEFIKSIFVR